MQQRSPDGPLRACVAPIVSAPLWGAAARATSATRLCGCWIAACCVIAGGCAGYQFGTHSMYRPDIQTIYVPMIRNDTFRHDLGPRLSEALVRKLQDRTPYRVIGDPTADSTLTCKFSSDSKRVLTETATDEVRALDMVVSVQVSWISRQGIVLLDNRILPDGNLAILFSQDSRVVPEAGQTIETALQNAIDELADRIVSQMEARW